MVDSLHNAWHAVIWRKRWCMKMKPCWSPWIPWNLPSWPTLRPQLAYMHCSAICCNVCKVMTMTDWSGVTADNNVESCTSCDKQRSAIQKACQCVAARPSWWGWIYEEDGRVISAAIGLCLGAFGAFGAACNMMVNAGWHMDGIQTWYFFFEIPCVDTMHFCCL